jgi:hypothetical protein
VVAPTGRAAYLGRHDRLDSSFPALPGPDRPACLGAAAPGGACTAAARHELDVLTPAATALRERSRPIDAECISDMTTAELASQGALRQAEEKRRRSGGILAAVQIMRLLTRREPERTEHWTSLATFFDQLGDSNQARRCRQIATALQGQPRA